MSVKKLNVYIIHADSLQERRKVIDDLRKNLAKYSFSKLQVGDINVITSHETSSITGDTIQKIVNYTPLQTEEEDIKIYNSLIRILHVNNLSNALKHLEALKLIAASTEVDTVHMVLEDDIMFEPRMCLLLDKLMDKLKGEDIVFLGMPNNEAASSSNNIQLKECKSIFKVLPYNDSYIITPKTAAKFVERFLPLKFYTNIQMSYILDTEGIKAKQTVPNIFIDGSKYGMFLSTQMANNDLVFSKDYMFIKSLLAKPIAEISKDEKDLADRIIAESQIMSNPDFLAVAGKYVREIKKDYKKTLNMYQKAFDIYQKNGAIINNESLFLRDFITLHSFLQTDVPC